jgi:hypothetical protein
MPEASPADSPTAGPPLGQPPRAAPPPGHSSTAGTPPDAPPAPAPPPGHSSPAAAPPGHPPTAGTPPGDSPTAAVPEGHWTPSGDSTAGRLLGSESPAGWSPPPGWIAGRPGRVSWPPAGVLAGVPPAARAVRSGLKRDASSVPSPPAALGAAAGRSAGASLVFGWSSRYNRRPLGRWVVAGEYGGGARPVRSSLIPRDQPLANSGHYHQHGLSQDLSKPLVRGGRRSDAH